MVCRPHRAKGAKTMSIWAILGLICLVYFILQILVGFFWDW